MKISSPFFIGFGSCLSSLVAVFLSFLSAAPLKAEVLFEEGFEESDVEALTIFIPEESSGGNCVVQTTGAAPHAGTRCLQMKSDNFARFSASPKTDMPVQENARYRISAWVKVGEDAEVKPGQPGFLVRVAFKNSERRLIDDYFLHILPGNEVGRRPVMPLTAAALGPNWQKVEAVIEVPPGVAAGTIALFAWHVRGTLYVDDLKIEEVSPETPVTPVIE